MPRRSVVEAPLALTFTTRHSSLPCKLASELFSLWVRPGPFAVGNCLDAHDRRRRLSTLRRRCLQPLRIARDCVPC